MRVLARLWNEQVNPSQTEVLSTTTAEAALVAQVSAFVSPMGKSKALKTMEKSVRSAGP